MFKAVDRAALITTVKQLLGSVVVEERNGIGCWGRVILVGPFPARGQDLCVVVRAERQQIPWCARLIDESQDAAVDLAIGEIAGGNRHLVAFLLCHRSEFPSNCLALTSESDLRHR